jgi:hypothetical protein
MTELTSINGYYGNVPPGVIQNAIESYHTYKSDKERLMSRIRDNEKLYRDSYDKLTPSLESEMDCSTSFILSAIENFRADASESYPQPNILEREEAGTEAAEALSKLIPIQLDRAGFRKTFKNNSRNKAKYGTAIYGVFYDEPTGDIDIRELDIRDVYVDMHLPNIQDSAFLFISAVIENETLAHHYPDFKDIFTGDAEIESIAAENYTLKNHTLVLDCYYKTADGKVQMMKMCNNTIIAATEDMEYYRDGLYKHGKYPVVFDVMYDDCNSPFGFGMIDMGKSTQIGINKLDAAITENVMVCSKPRYLSKRNAGIDKEAFSDVSNVLVEFEGDGEGIRPIEATQINSDALTYREYKKDELKELLANRDFQQGGTAGGVVAASAIEALQQSGEKRARSVISDSYDAYREIVKMIVEIIRQFYTEPRSFRTQDENGKKSFIEFSSDLMKKTGIDGMSEVPLEFDIEIVAQKENPYTRETINQTLINLWSMGILNPDTADQAIVLLKSMQFDGKDKLVSDFQALIDQKPTNAAPVQNVAQNGVQNVPQGIQNVPQGVPTPDMNMFTQGGSII